MYDGVKAGIGDKAAVSELLVCGRVRAANSLVNRVGTWIKIRNSPMGQIRISNFMVRRDVAHRIEKGNTASYPCISIQFLIFECW